MTRSGSQSLEYHHIVVVHGIGNQAPNETSLAFMNQLLEVLAGEGWSVRRNNLVATVDAAFKKTREGRPERHGFLPSYMEVCNARRTAIIGYSEVYWMPIPDAYLARNQGHLPLPLFSWAESVSARLSSGTTRRRARAVLANAEQLLRLLRQIAVLWGKSQSFNAVTTEFLGDVELYAESDEIRRVINDECWSVLSRVGIFRQRLFEHLPPASRELLDARAQDQTPFIHIVAHSEGTVLAYTSLVEAAQLLGPGATPSNQRLRELETALTNVAAVRYALEDESLLKTTEVAWWLPRVAALYTIGSPLSKHIELWADRFRTDFLPPRFSWNRRINWWNFWDKSDPVGGGVSRLFPPDPHTTDAKRLFNRRADAGYWRYPVPFKAHIDYWKDKGIYRAVVAELFGTPDPKSVTVRNRWWVRPFLTVADWLAYPVVRLLTIVLGLVFASHLLAPARELFPCISCQAAVSATVVRTALVLGGSLLLGKLFSPLRLHESPVARAIGFLMTVPFICFAFLVALYPPPLPSSSLEASIIAASPNYVGNLIGLASVCLVWQLHTRVHRGLRQMWRHAH